MSAIDIGAVRGSGTLQSDRLTRQELTWLLTQEAKSAADKLRTGVKILSMPPRAQTDVNTAMEPALNALDDAMRMLSNLHAGAATRGRKGRIDLASLVWEISPDARVSIEPGAGTEVFGDEGDLRRMLQVLVGSTTPTSARGELSAPSVSIAREAGYIRVSVTLGPDSSANAETERAWLSRMALRYGGVFELDGANESLVLPAGDATDQREIEVLRQELQAAQKQGEAYARELAAVFTQQTQDDAERPSSEMQTVPGALDLLARVARGFEVQARTLVRDMSDNLASPAGEDDRGALRWKHHVEQGHELQQTLGRLGACAQDEAEAQIDLCELLRTTIDDISAKAAAQRVKLAASLPEPCWVGTRPMLAALAVRLILTDAVAAAPPGSAVSVHIESAARKVFLVVQDDGARVPLHGRKALLAASLEPSVFGRPNTGNVALAAALLLYAGGGLSFTDSEKGTALRLTLTGGAPR